MRLEQLYLLLSSPPQSRHLLLLLLLASYSYRWMDLVSRDDINNLNGWTHDETDQHKLPWEKYLAMTAHATVLVAVEDVHLHSLS